MNWGPSASEVIFNSCFLRSPTRCPLCICWVKPAQAATFCLIYPLFLCPFKPKMLVSLSPASPASRARRGSWEGKGNLALPSLLASLFPFWFPCWSCGSPAWDDAMGFLLGGFWEFTKALLSGWASLWPLLSPLTRFRSPRMHLTRFSSLENWSLNPDRFFQISLLDFTHLSSRYKEQNPSFTIGNEEGVKGNPTLL